ncbi:hypothetical protein DFQ28_006895 [Apophysomyces sp. BC1034]|nr:hypothetical protein DFQ29_007967 [Apophysomyces sp. BC1021]KAG0187090.1 hypothetical protein DFQ28_006895 [Apophysomyces sp. BC1034]
MVGYDKQHWLKLEKDGSYQLTDDAKTEFRKKFNALKDEQEWKLREGIYIEDVMYNFGISCTHEHPVHSFVLCIYDPC